jgi:superfamily I DNA and/or RNA helicase/very-short-patch-repair endonuclease
MSISFDRWKNSLIDFSRRNKLLHFKKNLGPSVNLIESAEEVFRKFVLEQKDLGFKSKPQAAQVESLDNGLGLEAEDEIAFDESIFDMASITPILDEDTANILLTDKDDRELELVLSRLRSRSRDSLSDQGVNILFVALNFLHWQDKSSDEDLVFESPVLLVPACLTRKGLSGSYRLEILQDELRVNPTLAYKFKRDFAIDLSPLEDKLEEIISESLPVTEFFSELQKILDVHGDLTKSWKLVDENYLSLFSFAKLSMYQDLESNQKLIEEHPIVKRVSGHGLSSTSFSLTQNYADVKPENIDQKYKSLESFQILDADSSQQAAIYSAREGQSFVLQGPPGTGKSQTIANIISESLAQGKKILFVSEKKAALDVVYERLKLANLDQFCLDLHGSQQSKASIMQKLASSNEEVKKLALKADPELYVEPLDRLKEELDQNLNEFHKVRYPVNLSLYQLYSKLSLINWDLRGYPQLEFTIRNIERIGEKELYDLRFFFEDFGRKSFIINNYHKFIWRNVRIEQINYELENEIRSNLIEARSLSQKLFQLASPIAERYFNRKINSLNELKWLAEATRLAIDSPFPQESWLSKTKIKEIESVTLKAKDKYEEYYSIKENLLSQYSSEFLNLDHFDLLAKFRSDYSDDNLFRFLNINYWKDMKRIKELALYDQVKGLHSLIRDLEQAAELDKKQDQLAKQDTDLSYNLGNFYKKYNTDWQETLTAINWVKKIIGKLELDELPKNLAEILAESDNEEAFKNFQRAGHEFLKAFELFKGHVDFYYKLFPVPNVDLENLSFKEFDEHFDDLIKNIVQIEDWLEFRNLKNRAIDLGLGQLFEAIVNSNADGEALYSGAYSADLGVNNFSSEILEKIFLSKFYQSWIDKIEIENPNIRKFSGSAQALLTEKFIKLDKDQIENVRRKLCERLALNWLEYYANPINQRALDVFNLEINKKKRHKPVRVLIREIPNLLQTLKPCWMMSPLSVSQLLNTEGEIDNELIDKSFKFDLVIFDEASQIRTEDAIPAIYRGKQLILAGDTNQLPPTNFFNSFANEEDDDDDTEKRNFESVLDECAVFLPKKDLVWHYRSKHEDLIQFSNHYIYDGQLITFPSPVKQSEEFGVHFELVPDGKFEKGARFNKKEARTVAEAIVNHYSGPYRHYSLGVIAFSEAQQMAIERELLNVLRKDAEISEAIIANDLFIKNLENVQGDERDFIFFSVGYARDKKGNLSHNFGPLNREGGHRRLNVAITRARNKIKIFSSISSADIDLSRSNARGVRMLKEYLKYAETQFLSTAKAYLKTSLNESGDIHKIIAKALEAKGFIVDQFLGSSAYKVDLAVRDRENPEHYSLGIELDGYFYKSAKSIRDRERLRKQIMQSLGWNVCKVWSRDWVKNPDAETEKILNQLNSHSSII